MGKAALEARRGNHFFVDPNNITIVGLDTSDGPEHPLYDERVKLPLEESTIRDFMIRGVLEPILVRKDGDAIEVIDGRQRVRHAREANKRLAKEGSTLIEVPTLVKKGSDAELFGISISTNEHRRGDSPVVKAEKVRRYMAMGKNEEDASIAFGVSVQTIKNWGKLLDLDAKVLRAVDSGKIPASSAWNLSGLSRDEQLEALDKLFAGGGKVTSERVSKAVKAKKTNNAEVSLAPGKRLVTKVLKLNKKSETLPSDFVRGALWVLGDLNDASIAGLRALIREAKGETE